MKLLFAVSETPAGRESIVGAFDNAKLLANIFVLVRFAWGNLAAQATGLLNNLALDDNFKKVSYRAQDFFSRGETGFCV